MKELVFLISGTGFSSDNKLQQEADLSKYFLPGLSHILTMIHGQIALVKLWTNTGMKLGFWMSLLMNVLQLFYSVMCVNLGRSQTAMTK